MPFLPGHTFGATKKTAATTMGNSNLAKSSTHDFPRSEVISRLTFDHFAKLLRQTRYNCGPERMRGVPGQEN